MTPSTPRLSIFRSTPKTTCRVDTELLASAERILSLTLVLLFCVLCGLFFWNGGGLWRDEANSVALVQERSFSQIVRHLDSDSFPLLWLLLLRLWTTAFGAQSDLAIRSFGLLTASGVVAALLWQARSWGMRFPFWSFLLLGLNPVFIRCIGSTRAYGLGTILVLWAGTAFWQASRDLTRRRALTAFFVSLLCVQCIYYNLLFVGVMCLGGFLIACRRRDRRAALFFLSTVTADALSLLPYLPTITRQHAWSGLVAHNVTSKQLFGVLMQALCADGPAMLLVWTALIICVIFISVRRLRQPTSVEDASHADRDVYALTVLTVSALGYWAFLQVLQYQTSSWYYTEIMALAAIQAESLLCATPSPQSRLLQILVIGVALVPGFSFARTSIQVRQTGLDLAAARLQADAHPGDLILVNPWYYGTTFSRYFGKTIAWDSIPPFASHTYGGMDLMKQRMTETDPLGSTLARIQETLRRGNSVWLVGDIPYVYPGRKIVPLPPAPLPLSGWDSAPYRLNWERQVQACLMQRAVTLRVHDVSAAQPISTLEQPQIEEGRGWRSSPAW